MMGYHDGWTLEDFARKDVFDSRDVDEAIEYLEADEGSLDADERAELARLEDPAHERTDDEDERYDELADGAGTLTAEEQADLDALRAFRDTAGNGEWQYGQFFIADSYFETYAEETAYDIGAVDRDASWPNTYIDWSAAADALKMDYYSVDVAGTTFWTTAEG